MRGKLGNANTFGKFVQHKTLYIIKKNKLKKSILFFFQAGVPRFGGASGADESRGGGGNQRAAAAGTLAHVHGDGGRRLGHGAPPPRAVAGAGRRPPASHPGDLAQSRTAPVPLQVRLPSSFFNHRLQVEVRKFRGGRWKFSNQIFQSGIGLPADNPVVQLAISEISDPVIGLPDLGETFIDTLRDIR